MNSLSELPPAVTTPMRIRRVVLATLRRTAYGVLTVCAWLAFGLPTGVDAWLDVSLPPAKADAIVCLTGGITSYDTPSDAGWDRVHTTSQLVADGFAPYVVFTGGGSGRVSQAEIYQEAAVWFGVPSSITVAETGSQRTADHPQRVRGLRLPDGRLLSSANTLLIVTSEYHSRRALMAFRKAGFLKVRVVSRYRSTRTGGRHARASADPGYAPSAKSYNDPLVRFVDRAGRLALAVRETAAIAVYRARGWL